MGTSLLRTGRNTGKKVTRKMISDEDDKVKNSANTRATRISKALKSGVSLNSNEFPKQMTTAERNSLKNDLAQTQKILSSKPNYKLVGSRLPSGPAPR